MISIAAEMEKLSNPFIFLEWNDEKLESTFRQCISKAKPKMTDYFHRGHWITEFKVDETLLRKALEKEQIHTNGAVMAMLDALTTTGSIRIAH